MIIYILHVDMGDAVQGSLYHEPVRFQGSLQWGPWLQVLGVQ